MNTPLSITQRINRWWRHLTMTRWYARRCFPESVLQAITATVAASEATHGGEIRIAIEADWSMQALWRDWTPRQRALEVFANLQVWDTAQRNGVLLYLSLADRAVEIVADRGLQERVNEAEWRTIGEQLQQQCAHGRYEAALSEAVQAIGRLLAREFPAADRNEQSDRPVML